MRLLCPPSDARTSGEQGSLSRAGDPAYHEVFGLPFWEDLAAHPEIATSFDDLIGLAGHGIPTLCNRRWLGAGADLYLLRGVLNDWPDREAKAILRRCAEAALPKGRVVVLNGVGPDSAPRGLSIEMMLLGGKHRTVAEFRELARQSRLEVSTAGRQFGYFVVECRPASRNSANQF